MKIRKNSEVVQILESEYGLQIPKYQPLRANDIGGMPQKSRTAADEFTRLKRKILRHNDVPERLVPKTRETTTSDEQLEYMLASDEWFIFVINHLPDDLHFAKNTETLNNIKKHLRVILELNQNRNTVAITRQQVKEAIFNQLNYFIGILDDHHKWERGTSLNDNQIADPGDPRTLEELEARMCALVGESSEEYDPLKPECLQEMLEDPKLTDSEFEEYIQGLIDAGVTEDNYIVKLVTLYQIEPLYFGFEEAFSKSDYSTDED